MKAEQTLKSFEDQWLPKINLFLDQHLQKVSDRSILAASMRYSVLAGGKRLRPLLTLAVLTDFERPITNANLQAACALELIHTYSLIHDDLPAMDNDQLRRGMATNHVKFGEANAILAGDALQPLAFEWIAESGLNATQAIALTQALAIAAGPVGMVAGQVADINDTGHELPLADLQQLHREKTGALIQYAVAAGAIMVQVDPTIAAELKGFAAAYGLAFQICDDILDVTASTASLGKRTHKDASEAKNTYPALLGIGGAQQALAQAIQEGKQALARVEKMTGKSMLTLYSLFAYFEIVKGN